MSLQTIASPSKEDESEEDDDGDELRESDNKSPVAAEDEIDEANLSAALDGLLMIDSVEVECWKEVGVKLEHVDFRSQLSLQDYAISSCE